MRKYRAELLAGAVLIGAAARIAVSPLPGSTDAPIFHVWSHYAATEGVGRLYGTGARFPERRTLEYKGVGTKVDYPPVALFELGLASPKTLAVLGDVVIAWMLFAWVRRRRPQAAPGAALAFWLNPAVILLGAALGYLDVLYLAPALAALIMAASGGAAAAGALFAVSFLTKPLAILVAPALALALGVPRPAPDTRRTALRAVVAGTATATLIVLPVVVAGGFLNMLWGVGSLLRDPFVSGAAANAWFLASPLVAHLPMNLLRAIGVVMTVATIGWAGARIGKTSDVFALAALAAFSIHAYAVLAVSVHENHLAGALPFLALASAGHRQLLPVLAAVSAIAAVNMNALYGLGVGIGWAIPRTVAGIDILVPLATVNVLALAWHANLLRAVAGERAGERPRVSQASAAWDGANQS